MKLHLITICLNLFLITAFAKNPILKTGTWRCVLQRIDGQQIAFNFETSLVNNKQVLYVINASEKLLVDSITTKGDSIFIQMPFFAAGFAAILKPDGNLAGNYIKQYAGYKVEIPFQAFYGNKKRYASNLKPTQNIAGRWAVDFPEKDNTVTKAVAEFIQTADGKITGTFLTPTGDYRYLEGTVNGDSLKLSAFDGSHAILFSAKLNNNKTITNGHIYSGATSHDTWTAVKDSTAHLPDAYALTKMKQGETKLDFTFPSTNNIPVSINDDKYKNKVVIIQILGSWCPNCMDETAFLSPYYNLNHAKGLEIIGLAYERTTDFETSKKALLTFQKRFNVQYPFLVTGVTVSDEQRTEKTLPQLDKIQAFPSTIFIDKKGNVRKIHAGYDGPATGMHYEAFKKEFDELVTSLLNEN